MARGPHGLERRAFPDAQQPGHQRRHGACPHRCRRNRSRRRGLAGDGPRFAGRTRRHARSPVQPLHPPATSRATAHTETDTAETIDEAETAEAEPTDLDAPEDIIELEEPPVEAEIIEDEAVEDTKTEAVEAEVDEAETVEDVEAETVEDEAPEAEAVEDVEVDEAVEAAEAEVDEATEAETVEDEAPEAEAVEADAEPISDIEPPADATSIYDEIEQLIEEKKSGKKPAADTPQAEPTDATETAPPPDLPPTPEGPSIYDEIEQLIEEKAGRKKPAADTPQAEPTPDEADVETAQDEDEAPLDGIAEETLAVDEEKTPLDEEKRAIAALEALVREAADEEDTDDLDDWQDFEDEPEETPAPQGEDFEDLERLISELESARIVPQPELEDLPPPDLDDDIEGMVSETLARIYASQKQYREAARVYEQLATQHPDEEERFTLLAGEMHALAGKTE